MSVAALLPQLVVLLLAVFNSEVVSLLKKFSTTFDNLPTAVKQIVLVVFAALSTWGAHALGIPLPQGPDGVTPEVLSSILVALASMGWFNLKKSHKTP